MSAATKKKPVAKNLNKPGYIIFLIAGLYFLIVKNPSEAVTFIALALAFDPFNIQIPFHKRPLYQQIWLYVHAAVTMTLFVWIFLGL